MKQTFFAAALLLLLSAFGCYHYDPQFEGPYQDGETTPVSTIPYELLTVENGQIHLYHKLLQYSKTLDNLPAGIEKASINYAHDRIAYQIPGENIAVVDTAGAPIGIVNNSANADWFDWHSNNRSLCIVNNLQLSIWGDPLTPAITDLSTLFPFGSDEQEIRCAAVTNDGSVVVAYRDYAGFFTGYECRIAVIDPSGAKWEKWVGYSEHVNWLRVDRSGNNILFGVLSGGFDPEIWQMNIVNQTLDYASAADFSTYSPQADRLADWVSGTLTVRNLQTGDNLYSPTGSATVTALDW